MQSASQVSYQLPLWIHTAWCLQDIAVVPLLVILPVLESQVAQWF